MNSALQSRRIPSFNRVLPLVFLVASAAFATVGQAQTYTTTFDGEEYPLSENGRWINNGLDWTKIRVKGGIAFGTQSGTNKGRHRRGTTIPQCHWSCGRLSSIRDRRFSPF